MIAVGKPSFCTLPFFQLQTKSLVKLCHARPGPVCQKWNMAQRNQIVTTSIQNFPTAWENLKGRKNFKYWQTSDRRVVSLLSDQQWTGHYLWEGGTLRWACCGYSLLRLRASKCGLRHEKDTRVTLLLLTVRQTNSPWTPHKSKSQQGDLSGHVLGMKVGAGGHWLSSVKHSRTPGGLMQMPLVTHNPKGRGEAHIIN